MVTVTRSIGWIAALVLLAACDREEILAGDRVDLRAPFGQTAEDPANQSLPISLPAPTANADWASRGAPLGMNAALPQSVSPVWAADIGAGESRRFRISAAPVVAGGRVFALDSGTTVTATAAATGATLWQRDIRPSDTRPGNVSGGGLTVAGDRLYVTSAAGVLAALDAATGGVVWTQRFEAPLTGSPLVAGDRVYVVATNGLAAAIDTANGRIDWSVMGTPAPATVAGGPAPALAGNSVILPFPSGEMQSLQRAGGLRDWTTYVAGTRLARAYASIPGVSADPLVAGGTIYAGNPTGQFSAFDADSGRVDWYADEGAMGPALLVGGSLFIVSDGNHLVRLNAATGARIWSVPLPNYTNARERRRAEVYAHYGPVLAGGRLIVVSNDARMRSFDPVSGALLAETELPGAAAAGPAVAGGTLFVVTADGRLHALR